MSMLMNPYHRADEPPLFSAQPASIPPNDVSEPPDRKFFHRESLADQSVIQSILIDKCYSFDRLRRSQDIQAAYQWMLQQGRTPLILDAGAHIGASVVYWAKQYPQAHITAWEPEPANFELLKLNTTGLNVELRQSAIGSQAGEWALVDPGEGSWGYRTLPAGEGQPIQVESFSQSVTEKLSAGYQPFIVKIDIEGGEAELFSQNTEWVDLFPILIIELHDWLLPASTNSQNFLRCIATKNRDFVVSGENVFSIANQFR